MALCTSCAKLLENKGCSKWYASSSEGSSPASQYSCLAMTWEAGCLSSRTKDAKDSIHSRAISGSSDKASCRSLSPSRIQSSSRRPSTSVHKNLYTSSAAALPTTSSAKSSSSRWLPTSPCCCSADGCKCRLLPRASGCVAFSTWVTDWICPTRRAASASQTSKIYFPGS